MTINREEIRKALDSFENDEFSNSKDILAQEIRSSRNTYVKDKLELQDLGDDEVGEE
jgi:hypothetical protein